MATPVIADVAVTATKVVLSENGEALRPVMTKFSGVGSSPENVIVQLVAVRAVSAQLTKAAEVSLPGVTAIAKASTGSKVPSKFTTKTVALVRVTLVTPLRYFVTTAD